MGGQNHNADNGFGRFWAWFFLWVGLALVQDGQAQYANDFGGWTSVEYASEVVKNLDLGIEQEFRFEDNARLLGHVHTDVGLAYKLAYPVRIGGHYRLIFNRRSTGLYGVRHRLAADLTLRQRHRQWRFTYRARMQWDMRGANYNPDTRWLPAKALRNKFEIKFQVDRRVALYADFNVRLSIFDPTEPALPTGVNRYRYRAGVELLTAEWRSVSLFFVHDRDVNVVEPVHEYIVGVGFGLENWRPFFRP